MASKHEYKSIKRIFDNLHLTFRTSRKSATKVAVGDEKSACLVVFLYLLSASALAEVQVLQH